MAKIGVETDKHDMEWGKWGKPQEKRLKPQLWYVRDWGQKKSPPPKETVVHEDLPKAKQLGMVEEYPNSNKSNQLNGRNVANRKVREPRKEVLPTTSKRNSRNPKS